MDMSVVPSSAARAGDALQAWSARAGIDHEVDGLRAVLDETKLVLAAARGKEMQNEALDWFLKELDFEVFDADTLLDELEYCRIRDDVVELEAAGVVDDDGRQVGHATFFYIFSCQRAKPFSLLGCIGSFCNEHAYYLCLMAFVSQF